MNIPNKIALLVHFVGHNAWIVCLHAVALITLSPLVAVEDNNIRAYIFTGLIALVVMSIVFNGLIIGFREHKVSPDLTYLEGNYYGNDSEETSVKEAWDDQVEAANCWKEG